MTLNFIALIATIFVCAAGATATLSYQLWRIEMAARKVTQALHIIDKNPTYR